jgi:hypothetical protein
MYHITGTGTNTCPTGSIQQPGNSHFYWFSHRGQVTINPILHRLSPYASKYRSTCIGKSSIPGPHERSVIFSRMAYLLQLSLIHQAVGMWYGFR